MTNSLLSKVKLFAPQLWQQSVRHRGKFNFKFPKPRHDTARFIEEITRPVIIRELPDPLDLCQTQKSNHANNIKLSTKEAIEFEHFMAKFALNLIKTNPLMLVCHKLDIHGEIFRRNRVEFKRNNTALWKFNTIIMKLLIEQNPKYKNLEPLIESGLGRNIYLFSPSVDCLAKNLDLIRKMPHIHLLGGLIDDRLYTNKGVHEYANLPDLATLRGQLLATLNGQLASITSTLSQPASRLSGLLNERAKNLESTNESS